MASIYNVSGKAAGDVSLPSVFTTPYRPDLIQRAVVAVSSQKRMSYGTDDYAGLRTSADYFGRRRGGYRMTINRGMSRLPREKNGGGGLGKVRRVPQSVGGRRAHPPKPEKDYAKNINKKEYDMALYSAIASTTDKNIVSARGHRIPDKKDLPLIVEDSIEKIGKTRELIEALNNLGFASELERTRDRVTRSGKARMRGRAYKQKKGVLIIVSDASKLRKAGSNIAGLDVETLDSVSIEDLAPGTHAGRLVLWSKKAIEGLEKKNE